MNIYILIIIHIYSIFIHNFHINNLIKMRSGLATGFNIKLSSVICHLSDDNPPLLGDNGSLFGDNLPFSDGERRGASGEGKNVLFACFSCENIW